MPGSMRSHRSQRQSSPAPCAALDSKGSPRVRGGAGRSYDSERPRAASRLHFPWNRQGRNLQHCRCSSQRPRVAGVRAKCEGASESVMAPPLARNMAAGTPCTYGIHAAQHGTLAIGSLQADHRPRTSLHSPALPAHRGTDRPAHLVWIGTQRSRAGRSASRQKRTALHISGIARGTVRGPLVRKADEGARRTSSSAVSGRDSTGR